jgi:two-component system, OmpR family, response regulator PhoP
MAETTILVIDDEPQIRRVVRNALEGDSVRVVEAATGREGMDRAAAERPDLLVLDLGLPDVAGTSVCAEIRGWSSAPIVVLSARHSEHEKVALLDAGADDYVTKPFRFEEVLARVQALLRRSGGWSQPLIRCGALELDTRAQEVRVAGNAVELTAFEYRLLEYLMLRAGQVVSKSELTEKLYEQDFERDSNTIEVFVGRLRRKLDPDNRHHPIETLRGRGYRIARG